MGHFEKLFIARCLSLMAEKSDVILVSALDSGAVTEHPMMPGLIALGFSGQLHLPRHHPDFRAVVERLIHLVAERRHLQGNRVSVLEWSRELTVLFPVIDRNDSVESRPGSRPE